MHGAKLPCPGGCKPGAPATLRITVIAMIIPIVGDSTRATVSCDRHWSPPSGCATPRQRTADHRVLLRRDALEDVTTFQKSRRPAHRISPRGSPGPSRYALAMLSATSCSGERPVNGGEVKRREQHP